MAILTSMMGMEMTVDCCPSLSLTVSSRETKSPTGVAREVSGEREVRLPITAE